FYTKKGGGHSRPERLNTQLHWANLPDHAGARNLDERTIGGSDKMRVGTVVPHCAIVDDIGTSVWAEPEVGRTVEPVDVCHERLVAGAVAGKALDPQGERRTGQLVEIDQLDLMPDF